MSIRVLLRDHPHRAIALATDEHILTFRHSPSAAAGASAVSLNSAQDVSLQNRCMVEFTKLQDTDTSEFRSLTSLSSQGTLGLITVNSDVFLCVVSGSQRVASVRPGEHVQKITAVEFRMFNDWIRGTFHNQQLLTCLYRLHQQIRLRQSSTGPHQQFSRRSSR